MGDRDDTQTSGDGKRLLIPYMVVQNGPREGIVIDRSTGAPVTDYLPLADAREEVYALNHGVPRIPRKARSMHEAGYSHGAIAHALGVSASVAQKIVAALRAEGRGSDVA